MQTVKMLRITDPSNVTSSFWMVEMLTRQKRGRSIFVVKMSW